ncbi:MAG: hypothetical protein JXR42_01305 [Gammaproteobacteria bacterium]|nr:hypothetical protein [Gammaproteobacteria bacterium]
MDKLLEFLNLLEVPLYNLDKKLSHLSEEDVKKLIYNYYMSDISVAELTELYSIDIYPGGLFQLFPAIEDKEHECPYCRCPLYFKWPSKTSISYQDACCLSCGHTDHEYCRCDGCMKMRSHLEKERKSKEKDVIISYYKIDDYGPFHRVDDLTARDVVYLLMFYRCCVDETNLGSLQRLMEIPLTPGGTLDLVVIEHLLKNKFIAPSPEADIRAFIFDENMKPSGYVREFMSYSVLLGEGIASVDRYIRDIEEMFYQQSYPASWYDELCDLSYMLALHECLEYFDHCARKYGFKAPLGEKTRGMFKTLLKTFSVSEIFPFIWSAASSAAAFYKRVDIHISKSQAANSMVGNCQRRAEKTLSEGWQRKKYKRDRECPRSAFSEILHDFCLKIGESAFDMVLADSLLE